MRGGLDRAASLSGQIASFIADFPSASLGADVRAATRTSLLDQLAVMLAASGLAEEPRPFIEVARESGSGPATVLGHSFSCSPVMAAFANGAQAHALDFEDTHDATMVHPNAAVVPAALALSEAVGASGEDLLCAIAIGADLTCRIASAFRRPPVEFSDFLLLPMIGAFGAAAACARLLRLDPCQTEQALALSFGQAVGSAATLTHGPSHFRAVRDAFAAKAGILSALLAAKGMIAFDRPLEGRAGYFELFAGGEFDAGRLVGGLGEHFHGLDLSYKPWPCCRGTHAFIEAALALRPGLGSSAIQRIDVEVSPFFSNLCDPPEQRKSPPTSIAAKFSIPFTVAVAIDRGDVRFEDFDEGSLRNPRRRELAGLVHHSVREERDISRMTEGSLTITLDNGERHHHYVRHAYGHPENPLGEASLRDKFFDCVGRSASFEGEAWSRRLYDRIWAIEAQPSLSSILD